MRAASRSCSSPASTGLRSGARHRRAEDGVKEQRSASRLNGAPASSSRSAAVGANTVAVIEAVKKNLERARERLPADVGLEVIRDQSRYINNALHEIDRT